MTRPLLGLTFCALTVLSSEAAAQQQAGANSDYRLTMPVLRKALPALYAAGKERCTERRRSPQEIAEMTVVQMEAELDGCAPVQRAAAAQAVTTRELAQVSKALLQVGHRMAERKAPRRRGAQPLPFRPARCAKTWPRCGRTKPSSAGSSRNNSHEPGGRDDPMD